MHKLYTSLTIKVAFIGWMLVSHLTNLQAQTNETMSAGAYIVNMGVTPQNAGNGLKPYGLVYDLLKNYNVPIRWVISGTKAKDGTDFTYNGVDYKGGPFIIPAEFRTSAVNARITFWQGQGVQGVTTTSPITVPVYTILYVVPKWTLDAQNGAIAQKFFTNAGIPASSYDSKSPAALDCCDDLFVMPHADPTWATHGNLLPWNLDCKGGVWLGCHAGSALEDMFDNVPPVNFNTQTNFLAEKTGPASGGGPYSENALLLWGNHDDGTLPYSYDFPNDPVMQFMGALDAATQNGSEQIFVPKSAGWRPSTKVGVYDPDHPDRYTPYVDPKHRAAVVAWGHGLGSTSRGQVMLEASHDIAKASAPANIAAQRVFFNFSFLILSQKAVLPTITGLPTSLNSGLSYPLSFTVPPPANPADYTATWSSSCGGTFTPSNVGQNVTFTPPVVGMPTSCNIKVVITDPCGRETFDVETVSVSCNLQVATNITQPCPNAPNSGSIAMTITNGSPTYGFSWVRSGGGSGSGSGTTISGLSAGTYSVTVTSGGGSGCTATFTAMISTLPVINIAHAQQNLSCNGSANGSITLNVTGGTPAFTYLWSNGATTANLSGLAAGTYIVTVTDSKNCTNTKSITLTQPAAINLSSVQTPVSCFGGNNGSINLTVSGGTPGYTYQWSNGANTMDLSGLTAGSYSVTVKDANNCTATLSGLTITQPAAALSLASTQVNISCNGSGNGSIDLSVSGGTAPYTYDWSNDGPESPDNDTQDLSSLSAGAYTVTVTDNNGCTATLSATITQPDALILSVNITNPTCPPTGIMPFNSDGAIDLTVTGGTAPFAYNWNDLTPPPAEPQDRTGLIAGTYTVTVTDNNGCTASISAILTNQNPNPVQPGVIGNN